MVRLQIYKSFYSSFFPLTGKDKLAKVTLRALINGNKIFTLIPVTFYMLIFAFTPNLLGTYTIVYLQKTIKLALKLFIKGKNIVKQTLDLASGFSRPNFSIFIIKINS